MGEGKVREGGKGEGKEGDERERKKAKVWNEGEVVRGAGEGGTRR